MHNIISFILLYRRKLNWSVVPSINAIPLVKWTEFQTRFPSEEEISEWKTKYPDANISLITGKLSGVVVFDADSEEQFQNMRHNTLDCGPLVQSSLPYKNHFYFKNPDNKEIRCVTKNKLDVKGEGGLITLPPSIHESGTRYKWIRNPFDNALPDMDIFHFQYYDRNRWKPGNGVSHLPKYGNDPAYIVNLLDGVEEGLRDIAAFTLSKYYAKRGFNQMEIEGKLTQWNGKNSPPLENRFIKKCVKSAKKYIK